LGVFRPQYAPTNAPSTKKPFYKRWWFIAIVVVIVLAGLGKAMSGDKNGDKSATSTTASQSATTPEKTSEAPAVKSTQAAEPPLEIDADTLLKAYADNELKADKEYKDKVLQVSGKVAKVSEVLGIKTLEVQADAPLQFHRVSCPLKGDQVDKAIELSKDSPVVVQGKNTGFDVYVRLSDCTIQ
jgi:hypothetical protein